MRLVTYFGTVILIVAGVLFLMVVSDLVRPYQGEAKIRLDPAFVIHPEDEPTVQEPEGYVHNDYVLETAFNLEIDSSQVTEAQFNERYSNPQN
jgi:hypothetical protein